MKKLLFGMLLFVFILPLKAQISFSGSMGIDYFASQSLRDYLNMNFSSNSGLISTFVSSVGFYGELEIPVASNFDLGAEYVYQIYSYSAPSMSGGVYNFYLDQHKFSLIGYYVIHGEGYQFKFGLGAGVRLAAVDEEIYSSTNYKSSGYGFLINAKGITPLGNKLFGNIGVEARYDLPGEPSGDGKKIFNSTLNKNVNINSFSIGLKIGLTYFF